MCESTGSWAWLMGESVRHDASHDSLRLSRVMDDPVGTGVSQMCHGHWGLQRELSWGTRCLGDGGGELSKDVKH